MIKRIALDNFKCFTKLSLEMSNLNLFTGINGMGKSTVIQAILLLKQAMDNGSLSNGLHLNGSLVNIGTGRDLLCRYGDNDDIGIEITTDKSKYEFLYEYAPESDFLPLKQTHQMNADKIAETNLNLFQGFEFISAERIGPRRTYGKSYYSTYDKNQLGSQGELASAYLFLRGRDEVVNTSALHKAQPSRLLQSQVNAWLAEISPGVAAEVEDFLNAGLVGLHYKIGDAFGGNEYSAMNVGFGITYVLPIIVSILKAKSGDLLIIENPEAHLHPKGQRKMGELIAQAAAGGVQIIVETHSDHILNGLRLAVKHEDIKKDKISLNYFYQAEFEGKLIHDKASPVIQDNGSLSDWPEGFFDEWDLAIDELF